MSGNDNNIQYEQGNFARYPPRARFNPPEPGVNPLWIFLAFIIVGVLLYFMYIYISSNIAKQEMQEYMILAKQAGTLPQ
jgi:hypothetical protein